ncbi:pentapeptide repeat-containing protein [Mesobacillus foraminis]|uniref:pentapeptide repeat-containing protein n=1 Tax=Mesobacillus foraminis TaxID=279826 RepID=UPI0035CFD67B
MSDSLTTSERTMTQLKADCESCFGLCCVALPYVKGADFAFDKTGGSPCRNLQSDYRCSIHTKLRESGFRGCAVYECFGAGQKVSQSTYGGSDWRSRPETAQEMFSVFPVMQQLHEMLYYLHEAMLLGAAKPILKDLQVAYNKTESLTELNPSRILSVNVPDHRVLVNDLFLRTSELARAETPVKNSRMGRGSDLIGAKLKGADLRGASLRGALLIAADLRGADMRVCDFIGADLRDADLSGAKLTGSIFLTQAQINSAKGDRNTKLPAGLRIPDHWKK